MQPADCNSMRGSDYSLQRGRIFFRFNEVIRTIKVARVRQKSLEKASCPFIRPGQMITVILAIGTWALGLQNFQLYSSLLSDLMKQI